MYSSRRGTQLLDVPLVVVTVKICWESFAVLEDEGSREQFHDILRLIYTCQWWWWFLSALFSHCSSTYGLGIHVCVIINLQDNFCGCCFHGHEQVYARRNWSVSCIKAALPGPSTSAKGATITQIYIAICEELGTYDRLTHNFISTYNSLSRLCPGNFQMCDTVSPQMNK